MNKNLIDLSSRQLALTIAVLTAIGGYSEPTLAANTKPVVNAGLDQTVYSGDTVTLSASARDPEGESLSYLWNHPAKKIAKISIDNANSLNASFVAPVFSKKTRIQIIFSAVDPKNAKASDTVFITIKPKPVPPPAESLTKINDTGVTTCGDYARGHSGISNNDVVCHLLTDSNGDPVPSGQDGVSGRDISAPNDDDGRKGFSFTKLDASGNALASSATQWSCVKDNVTGLTWEMKTDDSGLHDKDDTYVWYENDPRVGYGGLPGYEKASDYDSSKSDHTCYGFSTGQSSTYCNTKAFVNRVKESRFCGATNWRLPTRSELDSLVSYDLSPSIDLNYFPNTLAQYYWTSVPYAYRNEHVWTISFQSGGGSPWEKYYNHFVRLVHD